MAQWYGLTQEEVLKRLGTNRTGLNEKEAERRLETYGENVLKEQEEMPWWQVFLGQFKDLLVMILIGAAGVSMVTGDPSFTRFRLCNDKCTLSFSDWSKKINYTG